MTESAGKISYNPTDGLSYDPIEPKYWSRQGLAAELERVFEICHGCRLCFKYCDTFPGLFRIIDGLKDGDVRKITAAESERTLDTCFQCKLCEVNCPYTPRDGHAYQLDFPKLVHRFRAQRARAKGVPLRDRLLANPDAAGRMARASLGLANLANRLKAPRWIMEKMLGVHRAKLLPDFALQSFESWAAKTGRIASTHSCEAVLFQTCFVQHNAPEIGKDTIEVFEKNKVDIKCVRGLCCCGMPAWEKGDLASLQAQAKRNLRALLPFVEKGAKVIVINPTCAMMFRREYPQLVAESDRGAAAKVAVATMEPTEFLWSIRNEERFNIDFKSSPGGTVACHAPCHLRAQAIGFRGRDLLRKIPGVQPALIQECCGHDGTYAMTVGGFEPSQRAGKNAFEAMKETGADVWASECPLAALQFQQHAGTKPLHPMSILARAYRENGFEIRIDKKEQGPAPDK
jgi:glycerol-3-phosphate dehydrogenase subunit C